MHSLTKIVELKKMFVCDCKTIIKNYDGNINCMCCDLESSFQRCVQQFPCIESLCSQEHNHSLDHILNIKINHMSFEFFGQHI